MIAYVNALDLWGWGGGGGEERLGKVSRIKKGKLKKG